MIRKFLIGLTVLTGSLAIAPLAMAGVIEADDPGTDIYQQTENSPCVIGDNSCQNPEGFEYTLIPQGGGTYEYDVYSPEYTVEEVTDIAGSTSFIIGVDINTAGKPTDPATEYLELFAMEVCDAADDCTNEANWHVVDLIEDHDFTNTNNGNGYSDVLLYTFDLSAYDSDDLVRFHAIVTNATDGLEEFFVIGAEAPPVRVPEPGILGLLGAGLLGLGLVNRRRRKKAA
jgi:hypothetical protein